MHISPLPSHLTPADWAAGQPHVALRLETLAQGNGYTGPAAAQDAAWVQSLFGRLVEHWEAGTRGPVDY